MGKSHKRSIIPWKTAHQYKNKTCLDFAAAPVSADTPRSRIISALICSSGAMLARAVAALLAVSSRESEMSAISRSRAPNFTSSLMSQSRRNDK